MDTDFCFQKGCTYLVCSLFVVDLGSQTSNTVPPIEILSVAQMSGMNKCQLPQPCLCPHFCSFIPPLTTMLLLFKLSSFWSRYIMDRVTDSMNVFSTLKVLQLRKGGMKEGLSSCLYTP
ncbi:hypothetical protein NPIL_6831 [Nephila pilipes]|uniref:Uncharacterized protein n=1 Tax=Nephila pilipes TaxID=299642 RepID=A0A8X6IAS3_NEPPI|nr:hypothetical protein NPIL_6831 [Nephila pilipes]